MDMTELEQSYSAPAGRSPPSRSEISRPRAGTASQSRLEHAFSFQHLDDVSNYHSDHHDYPQREEDDSTESSDDIEKVRSEDEEEEARRGDTEVAKVQMGMRDTRDLEANLEKTKSSKSSNTAKDPNLVRFHASMCQEYRSTWLTTRRSHGKAPMIQETQRIGALRGNGLPRLSYHLLRSFLPYRPQWWHRPCQQLRQILTSPLRWNPNRSCLSS